ncbi:MAG: hypothetical protein PHD54_09115, partial [Desulfuromonadaceae bacterium]|nr:hypothetical protein [Desulfuromonadaceae bacterium]
GVFVNRFSDPGFPVLADPEQFQFHGATTLPKDSISSGEQGSEKEPTKAYNMYVEESDDEATLLSA